MTHADDLDLSREEVRALLAGGEPVEIVAPPWEFTAESSTGTRVEIRHQGATDLDDDDDPIIARLAV